MPIKYFFLFLTCLVSQEILLGQSASPYDCVYNHLASLQPDSYHPNQAAQSFYSADTIEMVKYAEQLKQVLDGKGLYVFIDDISRDSEFYDSTRMSGNYYLFPDQLPQIYMRKVDNSWYYPPEVFDDIEAYHKQTYPFGIHLLMNHLPKNAHSQVLGVSLWQIVGIIGLILIFTFLFTLLRLLSRRLLKVLSSSNLGFFTDNLKLFNKISTLLSLIVAIYISRIFLPGLQFGPKISWLIMGFIKIVSALLILLLIMKLIDILYQYFFRFTKSTSSKMDEQLLPVIKRAIQIILLSFWIIYLLTIFNVDVTALLAGISIGGVAIALAAQDTIKNLFGSVTIFMDKPFQIGDWIKFGEVEGTVEEVGFRSTRVRSFENSLMSVPNARLLDTSVNNYGLRQFRRFKTSIQLTYDTPPDKVEAFVSHLREITRLHPCIVHDRTQIYFNSMSESSLDVLFYSFFDVADWPSELQAKQEILLAIMRLAQSMNIHFAYPSMSIYKHELGHDKLKDNTDDFFAKYKQQLGDQYA